MNYAVVLPSLHLQALGHPRTWSPPLSNQTQSLGMETWRQQEPPHLLRNTELMHTCMALALSRLFWLVFLNNALVRKAMSDVILRESRGIINACARPVLTRSDILAVLLW